MKKMHFLSTGLYMKCGKSLMNFIRYRIFQYDGVALDSLRISRKLWCLRFISMSGLCVRFLFHLSLPVCNINSRTVVHSTVLFLTAMVNVLLNSGEHRCIADSFYLVYDTNNERRRGAICRSCMNELKRAVSK